MARSSYSTSCRDCRLGSGAPTLLVVRLKVVDQLTAFEAFKVYDGQIHAVEAFIRILPLELAKGGWD